MTLTYLIDFLEDNEYEPNQKEADYNANIDKYTLFDSFLRTDLNFSLDSYDSNSMIHLVLIKSLSITRSKACHRETFNMRKSQHINSNNKSPRSYFGIFCVQWNKLGPVHLSAHL